MVSERIRIILPSMICIIVGYSLREVLRIILFLITNTCTPCLLNQILAREPFFETYFYNQNV